MPNFKQNSWLGIPASDYENHMSDASVGQLQALSEITRQALHTHQPKCFALLGCCTGNGLEHISGDVCVHAVDINPEYLAIVKEWFSDKIPRLQLYALDLNTLELPFEGVNLCLMGLILEYVDVEFALQKAVHALSPEGVLCMVIQKTKNDSFVSKTAYQSLESLSAFSHEVDTAKVIRILEALDMRGIDSCEIPLNQNKSFLVLTCVKPN